VRGEQQVFTSDVDEKLIKLLAPLRKHKAVLHFPFFANTFPLAFHYSKSLKRARLAEDVDKRVQLISWANEDALPKRGAPEPHIFFSSRIAAERYATSATASTVVYEKITTFKPCWVFAEFNLRVFAERAKKIERDGVNPGSTIDLKEFVNDKKCRLKFDHVEIFTEIPEQADVLFENVFSGVNMGRTVITSSAATLLDDTHLRKNSLRLFLYGAPLTAYLLRKKQHYIPFNVGLNGVKDVFETVIVVEGVNVEIVAEISTAVKKYHDVLYDSAARALPFNDDAFRAVQYHYNRAARQLQHRSSFLSAREYAQCLHEHHQAPT
jgi:hypothetical protein